MGSGVMWNGMEWIDVEWSGVGEWRVDVFNSRSFRLRKRGLVTATLKPRCNSDPPTPRPRLG